MAHLIYAGKGPKSVTPEEWLPVAAAIREHAEGIAHRPDLSVEIGPEAAADAGTAHWVPSTATLALHTPALLPGVKAETVDYTDKLWRLRHPAFCGAIAHEAGHATYSVHVPAQLAALTETLADDDDDTPPAPFYTRREIDLLSMLEESRVEARMIADGHVKSWEAPFLVRMALEVVLGEFRVAETPYGASIGAALTLARVDAGSLDAESGKRFRKMILASGMLDAPTLDALRRLWREYQGIRATVAAVLAGTAEWPHDRARRIARDWIELVRSSDDDDDLADPGEGGGESGEGDKGEGGKPSTLGDALGDLAREESLDAEGAIGDAERAEARERVVAEVKAGTEQRKSGKEAEERVYGAHSGGPTTMGTTIRGVRTPSGAERAAAVRFQRELSRAAFADVERITTTSVMPPGRLRGRGAVMGAAQVAQRQTVTAEPFRGTRRVHTDQTKLRVAVLTDISGSMGRSEEMSAVLSYVLARGAVGADAKVASILFGQKSYGVVKPGQKVDHVVVPRANHSTEVVKPGLMAADFLLDLTTGTGARVAIIISDAQLVDSREAAYMRNWLARAKRAGVVVVWANYGDIAQNHGYGTRVDLSGTSPAEAATKLGQVIVREVSRVSAMAR